MRFISLAGSKLTILYLKLFPKVAGGVVLAGSKLTILYLKPQVV